MNLLSLTASLRSFKFAQRTVQEILLMYTSETIDTQISQYIRIRIDGAISEKDTVAI